MIQPKTLSNKPNDVLNEKIVKPKPVKQPKPTFSRGVTSKPVNVRPRGRG